MISVFGRHKQDDYESYNERANEKYDDDYIRPSEEERRECSHDHEQTYDNYDIPHHEIPKSGSTAPQPENRSSIEDKFLHLLRPGERIMWLGKPVKNASRQERGMAASKTGAIITVAFVIIFAVLSTAVGESGFLCSAMFFMLIIFVSYTISGSINTFYAVTDQRVIAIRGTMVTSGELRQITDIKATDPGRNIGAVAFTYADPESEHGSQCVGFFGIKNPHTVRRIITEAAYRCGNSFNN